MTVISSDTDTQKLTLTFVAEFDASAERVWQVWSDPRQLERWWGPPTWPATFTRHEFEPGGESRYHMTGPDGTRAAGWWRITRVDAPDRFEFDDGFIGEDGEPDTSSSVTHGVVTLEDIGGRTRMTTTSSFASLDDLNKLIDMGMEEGMRSAMGQIDDVLAA